MKKEHVKRKRPIPDSSLNDTVPQFCLDCAKYASCDLSHDEQLRERCPLLQEDIPLFYRNSDGYPDPTAYYALRNVERERKRRNKAEQHKNPKDSKPRHNTQVAHY